MAWINSTANISSSNTRTNRLFYLGGRKNIKYRPISSLPSQKKKQANQASGFSTATGTHDVGQMQFNTAYLKELRVYGITAVDVAASGCYAFDLAAWRLRNHLLHDSGDIWTRSANYHSRTYRYNVIYRADLKIKALNWADWLEARFVTYDVTKSNVTPTNHSDAALS